MNATWKAFARSGLLTTVVVVKLPAGDKALGCEFLRLVSDFRRFIAGSTIAAIAMREGDQALFAWDHVSEFPDPLAIFQGEGLNISFITIWNIHSAEPHFLKPGLTLPTITQSEKVWLKLELTHPVRTLSAVITFLAWLRLRQQGEIEPLHISQSRGTSS